MAIGRRSKPARDAKPAKDGKDGKEFSAMPTRERRREKRSERSKLDATPPWQTRQRPQAPATTGPYDVADAPQDETMRIDLGALRVPASELEMRVEVDEAQQIVAVTLVGQHGHMQLGAFAAPRSEGIWAEVRAEIAASIAEQKGSTADAAGDFGQELRGRLPADGGLTPVRFVGVDGPRWLLRAMIVGAAAVDAKKAEPFIDLLRDVVVVRGTDPLPVREPIPLRLPDDVAEQMAGEGEPAEPAGRAEPAG
ncbi:MAG: DUF3710 domain-containing protein [Actinomycetota bacterium]|nr:DUF3710 domain-containing protein [Actinomycetota bacterium]